MLEDDGLARVFTAPVGLCLSEHDFVEPDIVAISTTNDAVTLDAMIDGPADLVVEILSLSTRRVDRGAKRALYEEVGVREYWILDPDDEIVTQLVQDGRRFIEREPTAEPLRSVAFPSLEFDPARMF